MSAGSPRWRFRPALVPTIVGALLLALTVAAGNWQLRRADEKTRLAHQLERAASAPAVRLPPAIVAAADIAYRTVEARGRYVSGDTILLDNKVHAGVAGYDVLTPLRLQGGEVAVLIDRGWIAAGDRSRLPQIPAPPGMQTVRGTAVVPSKRFFELAPEAPSGTLRQNLVIEREQTRLGVALQPFVVEQTSPSDDRLVRQWARPDTGVARHQGYALQWYSFALLTVIFYVALSIKRPDARVG